MSVDVEFYFFLTGFPVGRRQLFFLFDERVILKKYFFQNQLPKTDVGRGQFLLIFFQNVRRWI